jgi:membrane protein implicated in regulation of membrane protease activity
MKADLKLDDWRAQWQSEPLISPDLRKSVELHSRLMRIGLVCDVVVTLVIGGGATAWATLSSDPEIVQVAIAAWLFLAIAWAFVLTVNRGLWSPSALEATAFLELSIRRCRSTLATIWFAAALFFAEVGFGLVWAFIHSAKTNTTLLRWLLFGSWQVDIVWLATVVFVTALVWYRGKKRRELARLLDLRVQMIEPSEANGSKGHRLSGDTGWPFLGATRVRRGKKKREV